jgi:Flp pilus assembly protein TadD
MALYRFRFSDPKMSRRAKPPARETAVRASGTSNRWPLIAICVALVAMTWLVYGQTLHHDFVNYDDEDYVTTNAQVSRGVTLEGIVWAFTSVHSANWHPLTWISHMVDCQLYGLDAGGHHLTNLLLHAANAILLFFLLRQMTGAFWRSAFVAALFAVHPLRVESVAWVSERKDVLSGLFFLLTLMAYVRYTRAPDRMRYLLVLFLGACGLMSKPMLVSLPLVLLLLDYWPLERLPSLSLASAGNRKILARLLLEKWPLFLFALASSVVTIIAQRGAMQPIWRVGFAARLGNTAIAYADYIGQMFWPKDLAVMYPWYAERLQPSRIALSVALLAIICLAVWLLRRRRYLATGWLWYLIMLVPVIGILHVGNQSSADRYTYLPLIGLFLAVTWGVAELGESLPYRRVLLSGLGLVVLASLLFLARIQAAYWQDGETLWSHALAATTRNIIAEGNLGDALYRFKGKPAEAWVHFEKSLRINRHQPEVLSSVGVFYLESGRIDEARSHFEEALAIEPNFADAHYNLGNLYLQIGDAPAALIHYQRALATKPDDIQALNNMAWILATWPNVSVRDGVKAVALAEHADSLTSRRNQMIAATLAAAYAETGRFPEAVRAAERAMQLAASEGKETRALSIREQLETYKAGNPFRDNRSLGR